MKRGYIVMDASDGSIRLERRNPEPVGYGTMWMEVRLTNETREQLRALLRDFEHEVGA